MLRQLALKERNGWLWQQLCDKNELSNFSMLFNDKMIKIDDDCTNMLITTCSSQAFVGLTYQHFSLLTLTVFLVPSPYLFSFLRPISFNAHNHGNILQ